MIVKPVNDSSFSEFVMGETYVVLSIEFGLKEAFFRICASDHRGPALYPSSSFIVVSGTLSSHWEMLQNKGKWRIGPKEWYQIGFLEQYYDGDKKCVDIFDKIARDIVEESQNQTKL